MTPAEALAVFGEHAGTDEALRTRLATAGADHARFATLCVEAGRERGLAFTEGDVRELLQCRHIFWLQRHIL
jgi:hypothetical protein